MIDMAIGLGCGLAAYLLSAYTTTTIVGGATTKIVTIIPEKIQESIEKAANTATSAATDNLKNLADEQVASVTDNATNVAGDALSKAEQMEPTSQGGLEMTSIQPNMSSFQPPNMSSIQPPNMSSFQPPNMSSIQPPDMSSIQSDALNTMGSNQDLLKNSLTDATSASGIRGLTQEDVQRRMQKMNKANINYNKGLQNASTSATNALKLKPFGNSNIKKFVPDQTNYTPGDVFNTVSRNRATTGGGSAPCARLPLGRPAARPPQRRWPSAALPA
jgi:hypothetical protein